MPDSTVVDWLLTCVTDEGASLRDIIAYMDYRNHAILTHDEFTAALHELSQQGRLERQGNLLRFMETGSRQEEIALFSKEEFGLAVNEYLAKSQ